MQKLKEVKKFIPVILIVLGIVLLVGGYFFVKSKNSKEVVVDEEENVPEIPFDKRPFASLIPSSDGHWLKLKIKNLVFSAENMDYELLYNLPDGRKQGVPGSVKMGGNEIERDLLLGSESSGKFRYDEGVENGTLTLRFRDAAGKLTGKLATDFHLQSKVDSLSSVEGNFKFEFDKEPKKGFFVVMNTFGLPDKFSSSVVSGPIGIFSDITDKLPGKVSMQQGTISVWNGSDWVKLDGGKSSNIGVFVSTE